MYQKSSFPTKNLELLDTLKSGLVFTRKTFFINIFILKYLLGAFCVHFVNKMYAKCSNCGIPERDFATNGKKLFTKCNSQFCRGFFIQTKSGSFKI